MNACISDIYKCCNRYLKLNYSFVFFSFVLPACLLIAKGFYSYSFNSANVRWNGTNINSVNVSLSHMPGSRDLSGSAVVIHTATGNDEFCLALAMG